MHRETNNLEANPQPTTLEHPIPALHTASVSLNAKPIDTLPDAKGNPHNVLVWINLPKNAAATELPAAEPTRIALCTPSQQGKNPVIEFVHMRGDTVLGYQKTTITKTGPLRPYSPENTVGIDTAAVKKRGDTRLLVSFDTDPTAEQPSITAAKDTLSIDKGMVHAGLEKAKRLERLKGRLKKIVLALGAYATFASGGIVDHAFEATNDAHKVVMDTYGQLHKKSDGSFVSYDANWLDSDHDRSDRTVSERAIHSTAEAMQALDRHDTELITSKVRAFEEANPNEILKDEQIAAYREQLNKATTTQEAIKALDSFMQFFGKGAKLYDEKSTASSHGKPFDPAQNTLEDVRWLSHKIIDAYSPLPAFIVRDGKFKNIALASDAPYDVGGQIVGDSIMLPLRTRLGRTVRPNLSLIPDALAPPADPRNSSLHELGHTHDETKNQEDAQHIPEKGLKRELGFAVLKAIQMNDEQTLYSSTEKILEGNADDFGVAFDLKSPRGLAHPDEWRRFNSGANKRALGVLIAFEEDHPGLVWYVVSKRLAQRSSIQTPIIPFVNAQ